eukprot:scaffold1197_cov168-Chaetoceros_neogracile.AAC.1
MMTFVKAKAIDVIRSPIQRPRRRRCRVEPMMDNEAEIETNEDVRLTGAISSCAGAVQDIIAQGISHNL